MSEKKSIEAAAHEAYSEMVEGRMDKAVADEIATKVSDLHQQISDLDVHQAPEEQEYDPFDAGPGTRIATLIVLLRIYDAQMALLSLQNDEMAENLNELHQSGKLIGSMPQLTL